MKSSSWESVIQFLHDTKNDFELETLDLRTKLFQSEKENMRLKEDLMNAIDEQKQLLKVSHVVKMDRENFVLKNQIDILNRRVAHYIKELQLIKKQEKCDKSEGNKLGKERNEEVSVVRGEVVNEVNKSEVLKSELVVNEVNKNEVLKSEVVVVSEEVKSEVVVNEVNKNEVLKSEVVVSEEVKSEEVNEEEILDEDEVEVYEKQIKNVTYYISCGDDMTIYKKNEDCSIGVSLGHLVKQKNKFKIEWT